MTQIFFPSESNLSYQKLYCYTNTLSEIVIAKIRGLVDRHCERVVFPGEKFLFRANDDCDIEISRQTNAGIVKDNIPCSRLEVIDR